MPLLAALLPHPLQMQRLRTAVRGQHDVIECADWAAVAEACLQHPVQTVVMDVATESPARFDNVRQLRLRHPRLTLVAYVILSIDKARDLFEAGRYGFDGLIIADRDDAPGPFIAELSQAASRGLAALVRRVLGDVPPAARDAMLIAVSRAHERPSPEQLADLIGVGRRRLTRLLHEAHFPGPHRVLTWGRLLLAAHMLEDPGRSADAVAAMLHFPSGGAFRNTCQRYVHAAPHQIRARGGASFVLEALQQELASGGSNGHSHGPDDEDGDEGDDTEELQKELTLMQDKPAA